MNGHVEKKMTDAKWNVQIKWVNAGLQAANPQIKIASLVAASVWKEVQSILLNIIYIIVLDGAIQNNIS